MNIDIPTYTGEVAEGGEKIIKFVDFDDIADDFLAAYNSEAPSPYVSDETLERIDKVINAGFGIKDTPNSEVDMIESMVDSFLGTTTGSGDYQIREMSNTNGGFERMQLNGVSNNMPIMPQNGSHEFKREVGRTHVQNMDRAKMSHEAAWGNDGWNFVGW